VVEIEVEVDNYISLTIDICELEQTFLLDYVVLQCDGQLILYMVITIVAALDGVGVLILPQSMIHNLTSILFDVDVSEQYICVFQVRHSTYILLIDVEVNTRAGSFDYVLCAVLK
jgi:exosome complex RNA-binding protein Rrp42 (RNase PH superfamily)